MKPKDILLAAIGIIIISSLLGGCSISEKFSETKDESAIQDSSPEISKEALKLIQKGEAVKKDINMVLSGEKKGGQVIVKVALDNPNKKSVTSIQAWLSYDPAKLQGVTMDVSNSAFSLPAPYDNDFDAEKGIMMLGRSNPDPVTDKEIQVAEVTFGILQDDGPLVIDAYDYREDLSGRVSANIMVDGQPYNVLIKPETPALLIEQ